MSIARKFILWRWLLILIPVILLLLPGLTVLVVGSALEWIGCGMQGAAHWYGDLHLVGGMQKWAARAKPASTEGKTP